MSASSASQADPLTALCQRLASELQARDLMLATAESCTGGGVATALTALAGSSQWFDSGYVTYSNAAKVAMLGVDPATLESHGAVSEQTAAAMANGALRAGRVQLSCAITGIAGPGGGSNDKPVGTVCFGWADSTGVTHTARHRLFGDRAAVREQSIRIAIQGLLQQLRASGQPG